MSSAARQIEAAINHLNKSFDGRMDFDDARAYDVLVTVARDHIINGERYAQFLERRAWIHQAVGSEVLKQVEDF